jgi:hypothetical protein
MATGCVYIGAPLAKASIVLAGDHPAKLFSTASSARSMPSILQVSASVDFSSQILSVNVELSTRFGHRPVIDWLLRLDLASSPPVHEQWHGQAHSVNGHVELEVVPKFWPVKNERWFLNLWMRDPKGRPDWDLVDTRSLL